MYKRKIEDTFQSWKEDPSHKPLVVKGVRQCGKTSSVLHFARAHFKHVVYLDFREHPDYKKFFTPNLEVDSIVMRITAAIPSAEIKPGSTMWTARLNLETTMWDKATTCLPCHCTWHSCSQRHEYLSVV